MSISIAIEHEGMDTIHNIHYFIFFSFFDRILSPQRDRAEPMDPVKASCINNETKAKPTPM